MKIVGKFLHVVHARIERFPLRNFGDSLVGNAGTFSDLGPTPLRFVEFLQDVFKKWCVHENAY